MEETYVPRKLAEEHKCKDTSAWQDGSCCCNCENQIKLMCHPWNGQQLVPKWHNCPEEEYIPDRIQFGRGAISEQCGWVCLLFTKLGEKDSKDIGIFSDREHGMCEMHCPKKDKSQ